MAPLQAESAHQLPALKSYMQLYTSITTERLATLLDTDERTLVRVLHSMQARIMQTRWQGGDALAVCSPTDLRLHT